MFGRNVVLSSATIPPDLAEGMYRVYKSGLECYNCFFNKKRHTAVLLCDEFSAEVQDMDAEQSCEYMDVHCRFIQRRVEKLAAQPVRRKGIVVPCAPAENDSRLPLHDQYFERIASAAEQLHRENCVTDRASGRKISFGIVRMAHITPCVELSLFLMKRQWPDDIDVRVMTYHSRQVLLLRHQQEAYLDRVLRRTGESGKTADFADSELRRHIDSCDKPNLLFIVAATPVEEIGRDHDFDWAVVEPSSYRSIIQLAGRVLRHRQKPAQHINMAVMQYNLWGLEGRQIAFTRPGYETQKYRLDSHDVNDLLDTGLLKERIDSVPRIQKNEPLAPCESLTDLEQQTMVDFNGKKEQGPQCLNGWIREYWWMTALPQKINPFRENSAGDIKIFARLEDGKRTFCTYDRDTLVPDVRDLYNIVEFTGIDQTMAKRLWITRNYKETVWELAEKNGSEGEDETTVLYMKYGEITLPDYTKDHTGTCWYYSDQLGMFDVKSETEG